MNVRHIHTLDRYIFALLVFGLALGVVVGAGQADVTGANDIFVDSGQSLGNSDSRGMALGDLDGDGDVDAFTGNYGDPDKVWTNNGNAIFGDSGQNLGFEYSSAVDLGDVDGDGDLDAFAAGPNSKLWINQGGDQGGTEGVFSDSGQSFGTSLSQDAVFGDVDGNGSLDIVVANYNSANRVWVNDGSGNFTNSGQNLSNFNSYGVALGDVDGDLDLDAVVANHIQATQLFINQGRAQGGTEGVFLNSGQYLGSIAGRGVALGDLDGDSDLDIFFANYDQGNTVLWNDGGSQGGTEGEFSDSGQSLGTATSRDVTLGDLDNDGDLDAVVANNLESDMVYLNDGLGTFIAIQGLDNFYSYEVELADLDGNGSLDLFVGNQLGNRVWQGANLWEAVDPLANSHSAALDTDLKATTNAGLDPSTLLTTTFIVKSNFLGRVEGHIPVITSLSETASKRPEVAHAWFYTDEEFFPGELVEATLTDSIIGGDGIAFAPYVWQFRTAVIAGHGVFSDTLQRLGDANSVAGALGDFDHDGDLDAFVVNGTDTADQVWVNAGGVQGGILGEFTAGTSLGNTSTRNLVIGDLDGDYHPDAFAVVNGANIIYRNIGNGVFGQLTTVGDADSRAAALGDLDSDGDLDAFVANFNANHVWWNSGSGHFGPFPVVLGASNSNDVALGDINNDGDLDAFVANNGVNNLWLNDGVGGFTVQPLGAAWSSSYGVALGDLDGDGWLDAVFANYSAANEVWLNDGTGALTVTQALSTTASNAVALGDVDGDGDLDAFFSNYSQEPNEVWLNDGNGVFSDTGLRLGSNFSWDVALGDLDNDGDLDALVANAGGPNLVWENTLPPVTSYMIFLPFSVR